MNKKIDADEVKKLAYLQFTHAEIATLLDLNEDEIAKSIDLTKKYLQGRLMAQVATRKVIIENAINGDIQAQKIFCDIVKKSEPEFE